MTPLATLSAPPALAPSTPVVPDSGALGRPVWNRAALLADLELRLGLPTPEADPTARLDAFRQRLAALDDGARFYSRSFTADPLRTGAELLRWFDDLLDAGWDGQPLCTSPGTSPRLATFHDLYHAAPSLPAGRAERLQAVEQALGHGATVPYAALEVLEARALWPGRWQRIFDHLDAAGVAVSQASCAATTADEDRALRPDDGLAPAPPPPPASDLERFQHALWFGGAARTPVTGDGSLVVLTGETPLELADAVAALVATTDDASRLAIIRGGEEGVLDGALQRAGVPAQGQVPVSAHRPALQLVPLLLALAFEQRDPQELLRLLTLPAGPFRGDAGQALLREFESTPGIGNDGWLGALETHAESLAPYLPVLSGPGWPRAGAPRDAVLELIDASRGWLKGRLVADDPQFRAAYLEAGELHALVAAEAADTIAFSRLRQLVVSVRGEVAGVTAPARSGSPLRVDRPGMLLRGVDTVVFWHCVGAPSHRRSPWRRVELAAIADAGLRLPSPAALLAERTRQLHRAVLHARQRLVLVVPRQSRREIQRTHPLLDELRARLQLDAEALATVTTAAADLRAGRSPLLNLPVASQPTLPLPAARDVWSVSRGLIAPRETLSASSITTLISCPLRWALQYQGGVRSKTPGLPATILTMGVVGHHLVERLHEGGHFQSEPDDLRRVASELLDELVEEEAMIFLAPGMSFQFAGFRSQLIHSIVALATLLGEQRLRIRAIESPLEGTWNARRLTGAIDVLLEYGSGEEALLDLKWGQSTYRKLLEAGLALQLAVYGASRQLATGSDTLPPTAYFSLATGKLLTTHERGVFGAYPEKGPPVAHTWERVARTIPRVEATLAAGRVPVTGVAASKRLLPVIGVSSAEADQCLDFEPGGGCQYCEYADLCGKSWEAGL